jgi:hypothetical protein
MLTNQQLADCQNYPSKLFEVKDRTDTGAIRYNESGYSFLDRIAKPGAAERRERVNQLFSAYPEGLAKQKLWSQIIARRSAAYNEFLFELVAYEYLTDAGVTVEAIEPTTESGASPDFLCSANGQFFFVEVVTIHDTPFHLKELNNLCCDLQHLTRKKGTARWTARLIVKQHSDKNRLDPNSVRSELSDKIHLYQATPTCYVEILRPGWSLAFDMRKTRDIQERFIRSTDFAVRRVKTRDKLVTSLKKKAKKYGDLPHPLIIFANIRGSGFSNLEFAMEAMYDQVAYYLLGPVGHPAALKGKWVRQEDSICYSSSKTENLDSVIIFDGAGSSPKGVAPSLRLVNPFGPSLGGIFSETPTLTVESTSGRIIATQATGHEMPSSERWFHKLLQK